MSLVKFDVTRISPKWTLNSSGNLQSGSDNLPGFEFNANGSYKGMLVEEFSRNWALDSEDWTTGNWQSRESSATITTDQIIGPDGLTSANKWTGNGAEDFISVDQGHIFDSAGTWTISVFAKKSNNCNWLRLIAGNLAGATNAVCWFDLDTGQVGTGNGTIEDYGDGWYRCSIHPTIDIGDLSGTIFLYAAPDDNDNSWSTSTTGIELYGWGLQIEKGDKASSYIKTTNQTVTRNEDVITLTSASQYLPSEGKVTLGWEQREDDTIYIGALSASVASGSRELVYEYSSTEQTLSIDGTEIQTITGQFDFSGMDKIQLGHINGADQPNTHLKYFAIV